jgi:hypothetical protein
MPKAILRYLWYVVRHKWWVVVAGVVLMRRGKVRLSEALPFVWRLLVHDLSKLRPSELFSYAAYFHTNIRSVECGRLRAEFGLPERAPQGACLKDHFNRSWLKHQRRNDHHWQYWLLKEDGGGAASPLPVPRVAVLEMVADWMGAGRAIAGKWEVKDWYYRNRLVIDLHHETRALLDGWMRAFGN